MTEILSVVVNLYEAFTVNFERDFFFESIKICWQLKRKALVTDVWQQRFHVKIANDRRLPIAILC